MSCKKSETRSSLFSELLYDTYLIENYLQYQFKPLGHIIDERMTLLTHIPIDFWYILPYLKFHIWGNF